MSRSIFDSTSSTVERSGGTFPAPDANQISQLPESFANTEFSVESGMIDFQPRPERPAIEVETQDDGKILYVEMTGRIHKQDYQHVVPIVEQAVKKNGKVRMFVQMLNFHGWDAGAIWEDLKFDVKLLSHIERLAIVGETRREKWLVAFRAPFTTSEIRYYPAEETTDALAWITEP